jgi:hypothetical protein
MSLPSKFNHDLWNHLRHRVDTYEWKVEFPVGGSTKEAVDVGGTAKPNKSVTRTLPTVLIEVELHREDPVSNVLKVWRQALRNKYVNGIVLIQGFSRVYRTKRFPTRRTRAACAQQFGYMMMQILGKRGKRHRTTVLYIPIRMRYYPRSGAKEGNGARRDAAFRFGDRIVAHLRQLRIPVSRPDLA